jgi:WD40 repeat protein
MKKIFLLLVLFPAILFSQEEDPFKVLKKHTAPALNVAFSPDGKYLATSSEDKSVILWNTETYEIYKTIPFHSFPVKAIAFYYGKESQCLFTNGDYVVKQWSVNAEPIKIWTGLNTTAWSIDISPNGKYMVAGGYEKLIHIWELSLKPAKIKPLSGHEKNALVARFTPDGKQIVSGSLDMTIKIWDWKKDTCLRTLQGHGGNIYDIRFSPVDTAVFASCSEDRGIRLWNKNEDKSFKTFVGHEKPIMSIAFSNDGKYIVSGSLDNMIKLWEISSGNCMYTFYNKTMINGIAINPANSTIAAALSDNSIALWNLNIPECVANFYYGKEIQAQIDTLPLFKPKDKIEKKQDYELRVQKAQLFKKDLILQYYQKHLNDTTKQQIKQ